MTGRGVEWVQLWDGRRWPGRVRDGLPEFTFGQAPSGLSTRRQLRERGLCRGGQEPFARLRWKRDRRFAWLYVDDKARAKRRSSVKQLAAVNKALAARRVCAECGPVDHYVRTSDQLCGDCHAAAVTPTAGGTAGWRTVQHWQEQTADAQDQADNEADEHGAGRLERHEASAVAARAAKALARTTARLDQTDRADGRGGREVERDEELARWHDDDRAAQPTAEQADIGDGHAQWRDERGVA